MDPEVLDNNRREVADRVQRISKAAKRLAELEASDEIEAACNLLLQLLSDDEPVFCEVVGGARPATVVASDMMGRTLLHHAAALGRPGGMELLLAIPAVDPNAQDDVGDSSLHLAAGNGDYKGCQALLTHADINRGVKDNLGRTPLDVAHSAATHLFHVEEVHLWNRSKI